MHVKKTMSTMNYDETIVRDFLFTIGYQNIKYEPDGQVPPDFLLNNEIAIEVRRLNQHYTKEAIPEPLEKLEYSLIPKIISIIDNFKSSNFNVTKAVIIRFHRPIVNKKEIIDKFKKLIEVEYSGNDEEKRFQLSNNFSIRFTPLKKKYDTPFILGTINDLDRACLVVAEMYKNLNIVVAEKQQKILPHHKKYKIWWLAVVDKIGYNYESSDIQQMHELPKIKNIFDKILIVSSWHKGVGFFYQ